MTVTSWFVVLTALHVIGLSLGVYLLVLLRRADRQLEDAS